ncbi:hypothetical protein JTB14_033027 [Gonioctena quinquepunctata]|nr:hypothetical protein JTB14_033027 [Gonioctena quinquepunctata]
MARRIKKTQKVIDEDGIEQGWEGVFEYIFPEDEADKSNLKLLAAAENWKKQAVQEPEEQVEDTEKDAEKPEDTSATKSSSSGIREKLLASAKNWKKNSRHIMEKKIKEM